MNASVHYLQMHTVILCLIVLLTSSPFLLVLRLKDVRFFLLAEFLSELWGKHTHTHTNKEFSG